MRLRSVGWGLLIVTGLLSASCDESLSDLVGPTPNLEPTFSSIQREIFDSTDSAGRRACTGCHNAAGSRFNGLDLTASVSYANLVGAPSSGNPGAVRVIPGDAGNSYLVHKLDGRGGIVGQRMPLGGPPFLTEGQILVIRTWIDRGALNN